MDREQCVFNTNGNLSLPPSPWLILRSFVSSFLNPFLLSFTSLGGWWMVVVARNGNYAVMQLGRVLPLHFWAFSSFLQILLIVSTHTACWLKKWASLTPILSCYLLLFFMQHLRHVPLKLIPRLSLLCLNTLVVLYSWSTFISTGHFISFRFLYTMLSRWCANFQTNGPWPFVHRDWCFWNHSSQLLWSAQINSFCRLFENVQCSIAVLEEERLLSNKKKNQWINKDWESPRKWMSTVKIFFFFVAQRTLFENEDPGVLNGAECRVDWKVDHVGVEGRPCCLDIHTRSFIRSLVCIESSGCFSHISVLEAGLPRKKRRICIWAFWCAKHAYCGAKIKETKRCS